jgi:hypothetical protein
VERTVNLTFAPPLGLGCHSEAVLPTFFSRPELDAFSAVALVTLE